MQGIKDGPSTTNAFQIQLEEILEYVRRALGFIQCLPPFLKCHTAESQIKKEWKTSLSTEDDAKL